METVEQTERLGATLSVGDSQIPVQMDVPLGKVTLRRFLPVIRNLSNGFIESGLEELRGSGKEISCKAGCGACCRQLVPISEAEAFDLRYLIDAMPEPERSKVISRFAEGIRTLSEVGFFERLQAASSGTDADYANAVNEYFGYGIACPFLENESCSIHRSRPITCREYLVTSPAELCSRVDGEGINNVKHFFQVKEALISLSRRLTDKQLPYVPLIQLMEWTENNPDDSPEKSGSEWAQVFFGELAKFSAPPTNNPNRND
ncbi:MAG TPA: YkgJ family cysteine cluster protein [Pyrinomonadaceae bacterium]